MIRSTPPRIASTAATPRRLASTRSRAVGEPARWMCPRTLTRDSLSHRVGDSLGASQLIPLGHDHDEPALAAVERIANGPTERFQVGGFLRSEDLLRAAGDPDLQREDPGLLPITSTKKMRSCEKAVSRMRSMASRAVLTAES